MANPNNPRRRRYLVPFGTRYRVLAGFLALVLALQLSPYPAFALRTEGVDAPVEDSRPDKQTVRAGLESALRGDPNQEPTRRSFMRTAAAIGAVFLPDLFQQPTPAQTVQGSLEVQVDQAVASLSLDQKVALFQSMGWVGSKPLEDERARHLLLTEQIGAMTLYDYNLGTAGESARMIGEIFRQTVGRGKRIPIFNIDAEGGRLYTNVQGATMVPGNMALGAIYTANPELGIELARAQGRMIARELRTWGATMTLSPVIDVNSNPRNPVIANRSIGEDPNTVGPVAVAQIEGLQGQGVAATVKHVPDHGDTGFDTHYGMAVDLRPRDQIGGIGAIKQAIAAGVAVMMPSHVAYPNAFRDDPTVPTIEVDVPDPQDPKKTVKMKVTPATISPAILTDFFRKELGFNGVIITDALEMGAIIDNLGIGYAALLALEAGADMFISGTDPVQLDQDWRARFGRPYTLEDQLEAHRVITRAVQEGVVTAVRKGPDGKTYVREEIRISPERQANIRRRIDESARRVLTLQARWGLKQAPNPDEAARTVGASEHKLLAQRIADSAVTLLKAASGRSLKDLPKDSKIAVVRPSWGRFTRADSAYKTGFVLDSFIRQRHPNTASFAVLEPLPEKEESEEERLNRINAEKALTEGKRPEVTVVRGVQEALRQVQDADVVVIETNFGHRSPFQQELLKQLAATGKRLVHLVMGNPYDAAIVWDQADIIAVGYSPHTAEAMARLLFEEIKPQGKLPVTVLGAAPRGAGLTSFAGLEADALSVRYRVKRATGDNETLAVIGRISGKELRTLQANQPILKFAFSRRGQRVGALLKDGSIAVWDPGSGRRIKTVKELPRSERWDDLHAEYFSSPSDDFGTGFDDSYAAGLEGERLVEVEGYRSLDAGALLRPKSGEQVTFTLLHRFSESPEFASIDVPDENRTFTLSWESVPQKYWLVVREPSPPAAGLEGMSRRDLLRLSAAAVGVAAIESAGLPQLFGQEVQTPQQKILADLAQRFGPKRLGVTPVIWGDPADILEMPDFFDNIAQAHMKSTFISEKFAELSRENRQAIVDQAKKAKLSVIGLMIGNPDYVLESKRQDFRNRLNQALEAIADLDVGELRFVIVLDVEPHSKQIDPETGQSWREITRWNGDLAGYSAMLKDAAATVREFSQRSRRPILYSTPVITFEPHWWVNGHETEGDKFIIKNLDDPSGIVIAGMTYQPTSQRILNVGERVWTRAQAKGNKSLLGLETKPDVIHTFYDREAEIPQTLLGIHQGLPKEVEPSVEGLFIHIGSAGQVPGTRRASEVIKKMLGKPTEATSQPARSAGKFGVEGNKAKEFEPQKVTLKLLIPQEWVGKEGKLTAIVMRRTDTFYKTSPFTDIPSDGTVTLNADRPLKGEKATARAVLVLRKSDTDAFMKLYDEGRNQGAYKASEKYGLAIIPIDDDGKTQVVDKLPRRAGLEGWKKFTSDDIPKKGLRMLSPEGKQFEVDKFDPATNEATLYPVGKGEINRGAYPTVKTIHQLTTEGIWEYRSAAGLEGKEMARTGLVDYAVTPGLRIMGILQSLLPKSAEEEVVDVTQALPQFSDLVKKAGYAEGRALLVSTAPPAKVSEHTVKIFVEADYLDLVEGNLAELPWDVEYVTNPKDAGILIGRASRTPDQHQVLLQVNDQTISYVDRALLLHLANYPDEDGLLFRGGETFIVGLRVKGRGDLGEATLIFA